MCLTMLLGLHKIHDPETCHSRGSAENFYHELRSVQSQQGGCPTGERQACTPCRPPLHDTSECFCTAHAVVSRSCPHRCKARDRTHLAQCVAEPSHFRQDIAEIPRHLDGNRALADRVRDQRGRSVKEAEAVRVPQRVWRCGRHSKLPQTGCQHGISRCSAGQTQPQHQIAEGRPLHVAWSLEPMMVSLHQLALKRTNH